MDYRRSIIITTLLIFLPSLAWALTPIAHTDVVPRQRIENGSSFDFGVVAFSKAGITQVDFAISGQGYASGTKTATTMSLNTRTASTSPGAEYDGVYEYYVNIPASEFSTNGIITVTPTVTGDDSGTKELPAVTMYVEGASNESQTEAWVDIEGSDGTGTLDDNTDPFPSIESAMDAIETQNGDLDYSIIYLVEDVYDSNNRSSGTTDTTNEWVTITKADGADIDNVIIDEDGTLWDTNYIRFYNVTIRSTSDNDFAVNQSGCWIDHCKMIGNAEAQGNGGGSHTNPVTGAGYMTSSSIYDVRFGITGTDIEIVRGVDASHLFDDFAQNRDGIMVVNCHVDDIFGSYNTSLYNHSDLYQIYNGSCSGDTRDNIIFYNIIATNLRYGTIFLNGYGTEGNAHTNIAFVNMFLEWRSPTTNNRTWIYDKWNHLLMWHCTISISDNTPPAGSGLWMLNHHDYSDPCTPDTAHEFDNTSYVGNVLYGFVIQSNDRGSTYMDSGNGYGNECTYNHYEASGTGPGENYTTGRDVLNWDDPESSDYGYPVAESIIVDRLPSNLTGVLCDAYGNARDSTPDVGALEYGDTTAPTLSSAIISADGDSSSGGGGGGGCFIATAAYGSPLEKNVKILRDFRDLFLLTNPAGEVFVRVYYIYSPPIAEFIAKHPNLRAITRLSLLPIVSVSWVALRVGPAYSLALILLLGSGLIGVAKFRKRCKKS